MPLWQFRLNIFIFSRYCRIVTRIQIKYLHKWADSRTHFRIRYIFGISYRRSGWSAWLAYVNCMKRFFRSAIRICCARLWQRRWNIINVIDVLQGFVLAKFCLAQEWIDRLINRCRRSKRAHTHQIHYGILRLVYAKTECLLLFGGAHLTMMVRILIAYI